MGALGVSEMGKKPTKSKKKELEKGKEEFLPGAESEEQFEKVLSLLSEWRKAGIVDFELDADGSVDFSLPSEMSELLGTQVPRGLTHKNVVGIIRREIPVLISAGLGKMPEERLRSLLPEKLHEKIDVMVKRSEKVINMLDGIDKGLKERILLRQATPCYIVDEIHSMTATYHIESDKGEKIDVPHLSLEFTFAKPRSGQMLVINPKERSISFSRKDDVKVTVDLHRDDIKDLIKKLNRIEEKIPE